MAQLVGASPTDCKVAAGSVPSQGTQLGFGFCPPSARVQEENQPIDVYHVDTSHIDVSHIDLSLSLSLSLSPLPSLPSSLSKCDEKTSSGEVEKMFKKHVLCKRMI